MNQENSSENNSSEAYDPADPVVDCFAIDNILDLSPNGPRSPLLDNVATGNNNFNLTSQSPKGHPEENLTNQEREYQALYNPPSPNCNQLLTPSYAPDYPIYFESPISNQFESDSDSIISISSTENNQGSPQYYPNSPCSYRTGYTPESSPPYRPTSPAYWHSEEQSDSESVISISSEDSTGQ